MHDSTSTLAQFLDDLAREARPGDRLPTIRELMRRFGASQVVVQRAFQSLKDRGLIAAQVGRGTHFVAEGRAGAGADSGAVRAAPAQRPAALKSVLLLRRSISIARGRVLVEGLQRRFTDDGHRVLEVSYTDPDHARSMLKGLPRFDACVVQSSFKTLPVDLLAALRDKCEVVAVDGLALVGTDVEAVGMEWGEPLAAAVARLQQQGHRSIACASTSHPFLATQLGWRRFEGLQRTLADVELQALRLPHFPGQDYETALVEAVRAGLVAGRPAFTALVAWGVEDGARLRAALAAIGVELPAALSVVLLGRTDLANEHADFFDTVGCSVADQVEQLYQAVCARWAEPSQPFGVRLVPVSGRLGGSIATPPKAMAAERASPRVRPSRS
jgi:DNA-binding LacI/PurR family transcriptional regulator